MTEGVNDPSKMKRAEIEMACNEATNSACPVLSEALSFFPKLAKEFIDTQNYAKSVMGWRQLWMNLIHKDVCINPLSNEIFDKGDVENLSRYGYSGEFLMTFIAAIRATKNRACAEVDTFYINDLLPAYIELGLGKKIIRANFLIEEFCMLKILELLNFNPEDVLYVEEMHKEN